MTNFECLSKGQHDWISTTADAFRMCSRSGCEAVERLIAHTWIDVCLLHEIRKTLVPQPQRKPRGGQR